MFSRKDTYYTGPEKNKVPLESNPIVPKLGTKNDLTVEETGRAWDFCVEYKALPQASTRSLTSKSHHSPVNNSYANWCYVIKINK